MVFVKVPVLLGELHEVLLHLQSKHGLSGRVKVVELPSTADTVGTAGMRVAGLSIASGNLL